MPNATGDGVADAANVQLADTMPARFQATLVSTTAGTCTVNVGFKPTRTNHVSIARLQFNSNGDDAVVCLHRLHFSAK